MANEVTATATISFSPTPSVSIMSASSTVVESPTTRQFVRMIGIALEPGAATPLGTDVYGILGGTPGWLWVKNIDPIGEYIYIHVVNPDQITNALTQDSLEIMRLYAGEAVLIKIGRGTTALGGPTGIANYMIAGSEATLYDAVVIAA